MKKYRLKLTYYCDNKRHLVCTPYSIKNLHIMARRLNINRVWFHNKKDRQHYDIPKSKESEITAQCNIVNSREILKIIKGEFEEQLKLF